MKIAVSYLSSNYSEAETIKRIEATSADYIHVDLMDGKFVENKNFTIGSVTKLLSNVNKKLDIHLMTLNPDKYFEDLALLNTEYITFHIETTKKPLDTINKIKSLGLKAGIAINPDTEIIEIKNYLCEIEQVLVMSVNPGKGGQAFIPEVLSKLDELKKIREEQNLSFIISVDGGINNETISQIKEKNIDMIVSGSYICKSNNFENQINNLK